MNNNYYVYILTTWDNRVLYVGVTGQLEIRIYQHKREEIDGFTKKYHVHKLVHYEKFADIKSAIAREKQLKGFSREKKKMLIESDNPGWRDLTLDW